MIIVAINYDGNFDSLSFGLGCGLLYGFTIIFCYIAWTVIKSRDKVCRSRNVLKIISSLLVSLVGVVFLSISGVQGLFYGVAPLLFIIGICGIIVTVILTRERYIKYTDDVQSHYENYWLYFMNDEQRFYYILNHFIRISGVERHIVLDIKSLIHEYGRD